MNEAAFNAELGKLETLRSEGSHAEVARIAKKHRDEVIQKKATAESTLQLGAWRLYEFRAHYAAENYDAAMAVHARAEPVPYSIPDKNRLWMTSVAAELTWRLDRPAAEVVAACETCVEEFLKAEDKDGAGICARNGCMFLEGKAESRAFGVLTTNLGFEVGNADRVANGLRCVIATLDAGPSTEREFVVGMIGRLREQKLDALATELDAALAGQP